MASDNPNPPAPPAPPAPPPPPAPAPKEPETFSADYVRELRAENKGLRLKATEMEQRANQAADDAKKAKETADAAVAKAGEDATSAQKAAQKAADDRVIRAELRTAALKAGMVDLDGLKLADLSTVKLTDAGEVEGAEALMTALKEAKPYLFGEAKTGTTNPNPPPTPKPNTGKKASEMTDDEFAAAMKSINAGKGAPK